MKNTTKRLGVLVLSCVFLLGAGPFGCDDDPVESPIASFTEDPIELDRSEKSGNDIGIDSVIGDHDTAVILDGSGSPTEQTELGMCRRECSELERQLIREGVLRDHTLGLSFDAFDADMKQALEDGKGLDEANAIAYENHVQRSIDEANEEGKLALQGLLLCHSKCDDLEDGDTKIGDDGIPVADDGDKHSSAPEQTLRQVGGQNGLSFSSCADCDALSVQLENLQQQFDETAQILEYLENGTLPATMLGTIDADEQQHRFDDLQSTIQDISNELALCEEAFCKKVREFSFGVRSTTDPFDLISMSREEVLSMGEIAIPALGVSLEGKTVHFPFPYLSFETTPPHREGNVICSNDAFYADNPRDIEGFEYVQGDRCGWGGEPFVGSLRVDMRTLVRWFELEGYEFGYDPGDLPGLDPLDTGFDGLPGLEPLDSE